MKRFVTLVCLTALCLFMGLNTMAQSESGTLIGTVLDPDGKAVVGATVEVADANTNQKFPVAKSGESGRFTVNDLPAGHYKVTVTMANFKTSVSNDVEIILHRTYELPVKLEVGAAGVTVNVESGQQLMETVNTSTQATVTGRSITNLPLNSRSALLLAVLDPGAETVGGPRNSAFEGLPKGTINITFDGINSQDNLLKSNDGFFAVIDPRIDDVEEFGITTSGNDPSKTGQGAVQMSYVSKRGGNAFHGGVWEYNRNQDFNSNYYFNNAQNLPRQKDQLNDFGYKIGGPVLKDKLFFFTDFDFFEFPQSVTRSRTIYTTGAGALTATGQPGGADRGFFNYVPVNSAGIPTLPNAAQLTAAPWVTCNSSAASPLCTVQLLGTGPTSLSASGGIGGLPTQVNSVVSPYLTALNAFATNTPGNTVSAALVSPFQESVAYNAGTIGNRKYPDVRLDYALSKNHSLEFDYHYSHFGGGPDVLNNVDATFNVAPFNQSQGNQISNRSLFILAERWTIGSNMSNEIRVGIQQNPINFGVGVNTSPFASISTNQTPSAQPLTFALSGVSPLFLGLGNDQGRNSALGELHETLGWTHGSHQFSFGGDATWIDYNDFFGFNTNETLGISQNFDPAALDFGNCFSDKGATCNLPNVSAAQTTNAEGVYGSLTGRVTSLTATAAFDPFTRQYGLLANSLNGTFGRRVDQTGQLEMGIFAADSWRIKPNVTINYGLRWEYDGPPYDKLNEYSILQNPNDIFGVSGPGNLFHPGSTGGNANTFFTNDAGKSWYNRYLKAFAPSVGVAYQPNWDSGLMHHLLGAPGKTVLRAGFSIAYSREGINSFLNQSEGNTGYIGSQLSNAGAANSLANSTFQGGTLTLGQTNNFVSQTPQTFNPTLPLVPTAGQVVGGFDPNLRPPLVESWNAGIQRELTSNLALEIRYQANHGVGLTDQFNLNEVNIFENGFLNEFNNANSNLATCNNNPLACVAAQKDVGLLSQASTATTPLADFANLFGAATTACAGATPQPSCATSIAALSGQRTLPILTAAFNNGLTPATLGAATTSNSATAGQLNGFFRNSTLLTDLGVQGAGSFANSIGTGAANFSSFLANLQSAGFPSNFFVVNPTATGGAFITTNGAQSTYNSLVIDLRHRPTHGFQFDASYTFAKALTNYQANSSANFSGFTTLRNIDHDKALAPFDTRHNVKIQVVYALPFGTGHRMSSSHGFVNRIIGGWEVDTVTRFQTGQPILVTSGVPGGNTFNNNDAGINLVGLTQQQIQSMLTINKTAVAGAVTYVPVSLLSGAGQSATANNAVFQPCNVAGSLCGKPYFTGPSFFRADISLVKTTKITERINFEMRMEALNAFNDADFYWATAPGAAPVSISSQSTRFGLIGSTNTNGAYSDINTTQDPGGRIVQLVGRINF